MRLVLIGQGAFCARVLEGLAGGGGGGGGARPGGDRGIGTGPSLLQKEAEIGPDDTVGSLYFNQLFPLGVEALLEAVSLVKAGKAPRIPQDGRLATYEPPCEEKHAIIDWHLPLERVYDLIRGTNPHPGAITLFRGTKLKLYDSEKLPGVQGGPGGVAEV